MEENVLKNRVRSLEEKLLQKGRELSLLKEMSLFLTNSVQKTLDLVAYRMSVLTNAKFVRVYLIDKSGKKLIFVAGHNLSEKYLEMVKNRLEISIDAVPCGRAVTDRVPYVVNDVNTDDVFALWRDIAAMHGYSSYAAMPLFVSDRILGVVDIFFEEMKYLSEDEINLMTVLSNSGALAIENAMLIERMEHLSIVDEDTGAFAHRHFMETLGKEMERAKRLGKMLFLVMMKIKTSAPADNDAVRLFVSDLKLNSRGSDMLFSYAEDAFCLVLTENTEALSAGAAESWIRKSFNRTFSSNAELKTVFSVMDNNDNAETLVRRAVESME